jgi:murein DD-endopeptidase MepM/ murein hydrolase activator NlpD
MNNFFAVSHPSFEVMDVIRRICFMLAIVMALAVPVRAETIRWVDFQVPYESLDYAMEQDIATFEEEKHLSWIDILALAACRTGGKCGLSSVKKAAADLKGDKSPEELLGQTYKYYDYYHESFEAALGGLLGTYAIEKDGTWVPTYGLKAFSPIAAGYGFSHCDDFGVGRSFGFKRKHLGHDMMGGLGTPIVAVEGGVVEALGWNRYGGWRVGIRSFDSKRYYYYAHLQKDHPFAEGLAVGDLVQAGDLIGFMGRTGYSDKENVNNIETVHLHFGMQLVFDESQKECNSEIWIDVYDIVRLLNKHRSSIRKTPKGWERVYPYMDLDTDALEDKL